MEQETAPENAEANVAEPVRPSDAEILQQVEREMGAGEEVPRKSFTAFLAAMGAFTFVCILLIHKMAAPVEAARPIPRWVNWTYSFEEAQGRAAKTNQKILIGFYTDWCPSCKRMDAFVYNRPEVLSESQNVVMAKINAEGRRDLAQRYNIRVYPSLVWTNASGAEVARHDGSLSGPELGALMAQNR